MGSPSGEVCLDNIFVTTSGGPVWVILKWEKRRQGKKRLGVDNKGLCVQMGGETPFQVSACKALALHETNTG